MSSDRPLAAHSIAEAHLFLSLAPCLSCGKGPLQAEAVVLEEQHIDSVLFMRSRCRNCDAQHPIRVRIDSDWIEPRDPPVINPTSEPSQILDAGQWLTLYYELANRASQAADRTEARRLNYEAALCLDEALKFYGAGNDLPPDSAFFDAARRQHARAHPELYARQRLLELRGRMPNLRSFLRPERSGTRRRWWRFWERRHKGSV